MALVTIAIGLGLFVVLCRGVHRHYLWRPKGMISLIINYVHGRFDSDAGRLMPDTNNDLDLGPIYWFHNPTNPNALIIFFHDVRLGAQDEQLHKSAWMSSCDSPVCWPETWLKEKYPDAQILSACYDSGILKKKTSGHMDLYRLGENIRHDILRVYTVGNPIFLVGHGFGGLVIKAFIKEIKETQPNNDKDKQKLSSFLENVKGILYYATPFFGSKLADFLKGLSGRVSLLDPLEVLSTEAGRLNTWFTTWRKDKNCRTKMLLAACETETALWKGPFVEEASARHDIDDFYTVSDSDHFGICKPRNKNDKRFTFLTDLIDGVMQELPFKPDAPIKDKMKCVCAEYMEIILSLLTKLEPGDGLPLRMEYLHRIRKFDDLSGCLSERLRKAGLEFSYNDDKNEYWEAVN